MHIALEESDRTIASSEQIGFDDGDVLLARIVFDGDTYVLVSKFRSMDNWQLIWRGNLKSCFEHFYNIVQDTEERLAKTQQEAIFGEPLDSEIAEMDTTVFGFPPPSK